MTKDELAPLLDASDALEALASKAKGFHPEHELSSEAASMHLALQLARLYVLEFSKHIIDGCDEGDALAKTLKGEMPIDPQALAAAAAEMRKSLH